MPPSPEARPDDGLRLLAERSLAAVLGEAPVADDADPAMARRVDTVIDAIRAAGSGLEARS